MMETEYDKQMILFDYLFCMMILKLINDEFIYISIYLFFNIYLKYFNLIGNIEMIIFYIDIYYYDG